MPLTTTSHDSLPYIDPPPPTTGPHSLTSALALITASLPPSHNTTPHPLLPPLPPSTLTPLAENEQTRIASSTPLTAITTSRYELPSLPPGTSPTVQQLRQSQVNATYLRLRLQHLSLLDEFGKNSWLIGNSQLETLLRGVEEEVINTRTEVEGVNRARKMGQEGKRGEVEGLERGWREGVGRVVDVEVAVAGVEGRRRGVLREGGG